MSRMKFDNPEPRGALSLRDRIKAAPDAATIHMLLAEGRGYVYASDKTRKRWQAAADARLAALEAAQVAS